jgi:hypothetical protein
MLPSQQRSGGVATLEDRGGLQIVRFEVMLTDIPEEAKVSLALLDSTGRSLARTQLPWSELGPSPTLAIASGTTRLPAGSYLLRLSVPARDGTVEEIHYPFAVPTEN